MLSRSLTIILQDRYYLFRKCQKLSSEGLRYTLKDDGAMIRNQVCWFLKLISCPTSRIRILLSKMLSFIYFPLLKCRSNLIFFLFTFNSVMSSALLCLLPHLPTFPDTELRERRLSKPKPLRQ